MLKPVRTKRTAETTRRFAIVASQYNAGYVDAMVRMATSRLKRSGALTEIIRVPGAYEVPVVAAALARSGRFAAIVCLGVVLRGETVHAQHIGDAVSRALMQIQIETEVPVIHEVLLLENEEQARIRCMGRRHNRGTEAAQTALQMADVMGRLPVRPRRV